MDTKNRLIQKLLKVAKRHKFLTYPILALVAVISVISNLFSWGTGAGKRVVAVIMVMVMLVSQSYFLTSSATEAVDDEETALVQAELAEEVKNEEVSDKEPGSKEQTVKTSAETATEVADASETKEEKSTPAADSDTIEMIDEESMNSRASEEQASENDFAADENIAVTGEGTDSGDVSADSYIDNEELDSKLDTEKIAITYFYRDEANEQGTSSGYANVTGIDDYISIDYDAGKSTYDISSYASSVLSYMNTNSAISSDSCYSYEGWYLDQACQIPANTSAVNYVEEDSAKKIKLYSKKTIAAYKVTIATGCVGDGSFTGVYETTSIEDGMIVKVTKGSSIVLSNLSRTGYEAAAPDIDGSGDTDVSSDKTSVTIIPTGDTGSCLRTVTLKWTGKKYKIKYSTHETSGADGEEIKTQEVTYGDEAMTFLSASQVGVAFKEGWSFDGWTIPGDSATVVTSDAIVSTYQGTLYNGTAESSVIIRPHYEYADIEISTNQLPANNTYQYKQVEKATDTRRIFAKYKNKDSAGSTNFTYELVNDGGLGDYGITVSHGDKKNGISFTTEPGGPTRITDGAGITVTFRVKDSTRGNDEFPNKDTDTFTVVIKIEPKVIELKNELADGTTANTVKTYNGTYDAPLGTTRVLKTTDDNVTVSFDSAEYYTADGTAKSKDCATAKLIKLNGITKNVPSGDSPNNYALSSEFLSGKIVQRSVYITTKAKLSDIDSALGYVRAGEANPITDFELDDENNEGDAGLVGNDTKADLEVTTVVKPERTDLEADGTYTVDIDVDSSSNYKVKFNDLENKGTFKVKHQSPTDPKLLYRFEDGKSGDVWHIGNEDGDLIVSPNPDSGYSKVYIYRKGSNTPDTDGKIREEDTFDDQLKIQLADPVDTASGTGTGAVSAIEDLHVKFQYTSPKFVSYKILDIEDVEYNSDGKIKTGLYFPGIGSVLDFGTYIKSTIKIQIEYTDSTSKMDKLHYILFNSGVEEEPVDFDADGKAVITVYKDAVTNLGKNPDTTASIIECFGVNKAGIESAHTILCPTYDDNRDYEWSIESGAPQVNPLVVYADTDKATRRIVADQSSVAENQMAYYNHCQASVAVSDAVSGIESITWYINDEKYDKEVVHEKTKVGSGTYSKNLTGLSSDVCKIYAIVADNAGNTTKTNPVTFRIDDVDPNIDSFFDDSTWTSNTTVSFAASDDLSGVDYIKVSDETGRTIDCDIQKPNTITGEYLASFEATSKGKYSIVVADNAGNIKTKELNVQKISTIVPPCPTITITPLEPNGEDGWYNAESSIPIATITNPQKASDDTPVNTQYRLWKEGETGYNETPISGASIDVPINDDGIFNVKAWTKSVSGVECENYNSHVKVVKVDKTAPDIAITTEKGSGATVIVNFTVTDAVSGVNADSIVVEHSGKNVDITKEETSEGVKGTFEISETGNYTIKAADIAGNESDEAAFTPMSLKVKAVTNITDTGATVAANVIKGTFDIKSAAISYRRYADDTYTEAEAIVNIEPSTGNASVSAALTELDPGTAYVYKVTATSDVNEILEYEGYFKTLATDQSGIAVFGTARYADNSSGDITVGVFDGSVCLMAEEIEAGDEFSFVNVPDGNYSIVATDGTYSKTTRLLIEDGMIVYPTQYIDLVLSGMNTSVVLTTESTPGVTVDDMDTIFTNDTVNFTTKDSELIDAGGTVEFKLYATLMTVSAVSADEISAMYAVTDNNKVVGAYLDLSLYKIVTDAAGDVDRSRVTNLQNPAHISVTIPLGDLAGKPDLEVVRIHNDGENFIGASLADQDSNPSTYTITTDQFSTYAVLYSIDAGTTATSEQPTTAKTDATTQDIDVKVVTPTGQTGTTEPTPASTTIEQITYDDDDDEDVKEIKDATKKAKASGTTTVGSLTSSGSAKTGDETPIMVLFGFMMISICGVAVLRKKSKEA